MDADETILWRIAEWLWLLFAPVMALIVHIYRKLMGVETRAELLEQGARFHETRRKEDNRLRDEQRREVIDTINGNHDAVMKRLGGVEVALRNGRD